MTKVAPPENRWGWGLWGGVEVLLYFCDKFLYSISGNISYNRLLLYLCQVIIHIYFKQGLIKNNLDITYDRSLFL